MSFDFTVKEFILGVATGTPTFQFYRRGFNLGGSGSQPTWKDIILSGNTALTLTNAKANGLNYLKLFGRTEQRNLPVGYTEYDSLISDGTAYIDLNCTLTQDDEIELEFTKNENVVSKHIFGARTSASSNNISVILAGSGNVVEDFNNSDYTNYRLNTAINQNTRYKVVMNKTGRYLYQGDTLIASNTTACPDTITTVGCYLFNLAGTGLGNKFIGTIHRCLIKGKRDVVPCGNGTAYGMYDKLNGVFYPNANTEGSFTVGNAVMPTPTTPKNIVCNNGALKYSANMANVNEQTALVGYYISSSGVVTVDNNNWIYQNYIPVKPNTTYTLTMSSSVYYVTISEYSTADDSGFIIRKAGSSGDNTTLTVTTESTTNYIRFGTNIDRSAVTLDRVLAINWMLNQGNSLPYAPYSPNGIYTDGTVETVEVDTTGDTATAEMLLKVGDYQDVQSVLDGNVTRNVGVIVFDGTENWAVNSGTFTLKSIDLYQYVNFACICTHYAGASPQVTIASQPDKSIKAGFRSNPDNNRKFYLKDSSFTSTNDLQTWLAQQYANGTPVIVVFPLSEPTTETVTGQPLTIQEGTNIVEITQASMDNLELEVSYKAGVEVTVTEIENAQLDNSVEVTVNG